MPLLLFKHKFVYVCHEYVFVFAFTFQKLAVKCFYSSKCCKFLLDSYVFNLFHTLDRQQFLEPGESVLMISMVKKLQKLTSKKVQLILTNKPKLIYVDPAKLEVRGNIVWSDNPNELNVQVLSPSNFKIFTVSLITSSL